MLHIKKRTKQSVFGVGTEVLYYSINSCIKKTYAKSAGATYLLTLYALTLCLDPIFEYVSLRFRKCGDNYILMTFILDYKFLLILGSMVLGFLREEHID